MGDTFLPYLSIKPGGAKRAWDEELVDGEKSRLCEFRFSSPIGLSSSPSSITYYLGHLGKGLNLQNLFPHLQSGDNNNIYLTGLQEKHNGTTHSKWYRPGVTRSRSVTSVLPGTHQS